MYFKHQIYCLKVIGILHSRAVHVVSGAAHYEPSHTTAQLFLVRHGTVSCDRRRSSILLDQCHATILGTQWHRWISRLPGERGQCTVSRVVETAQTFERTIGEACSNNELWINFVVNFSVQALWLTLIVYCDKLYRYLWCLTMPLLILQCSFPPCPSNAVPWVLHASTPIGTGEREPGP